MVFRDVPASDPDELVSKQLIRIVVSRVKFFFVQCDENEIATILALRRQPDVEMLLLWVIPDPHRGEGFLAAVTTEQLKWKLYRTCLFGYDRESQALQNCIRLRLAGPHP